MSARDTAIAKIIGATDVVRMLADEGTEQACALHVAADALEDAIALLEDGDAEPDGAEPDEAELIGYFRRMDAENRRVLTCTAEAFAHASEILAEGIEAIRDLQPSDFEENGDAEPDAGGDAAPSRRGGAGVNDGYDRAASARRLDAYLGFLLEAYGVDLPELADIAGLGRRELTVYSRASYDDKSSLIVLMLAELTGISVSWLLGEKPDAGKAE